MDHLTLKAVTTTTTDQGVFEAVISTESVDREKDIVMAAAMVTALKKWNRPIPLAWNHGTKAEDIFGTIEPMTVREAGGEVHAGGQVDLESKVGQEAWRSFKSRTIGFSFGYIMLQHTERKGGGREIAELDVFEITATPTPMNNDTRVLSTKGVEEQRQQAEQVERELTEERIPELKVPPVVEESLPPEPDPAVVALTDRVEELAKRVEVHLSAPPPEDLRHETEKVERELVEEQNPELKGPPVAAEPEPSPEAKLMGDLAEKVDQLMVKMGEVEKSVAEDARDEDRHAGKSRAQDPLRKRTADVAMEVASDGLSLRKSPNPVEEPKPELMELKELKQRTRDLSLELLSGME